MGFKIEFKGLVCHLTEEKTAVFIHAGGHQLRLVVPEKKVLKTKGFHEDKTHGGPGMRSFNIKGHVLTVSGPDAMASTYGPSFTKGVPSLKDWTNCQTLRDDVQKRACDRNIAGFLVHPGGRHSVSQYFAETVTFTGDNKDGRCIARTVRITFPSNEKNEVRIGDDKAYVIVPADACVTIINAMPQPKTAMDNGMNGMAKGMNGTRRVWPNEHFHYYYGAIFKGCGTGKLPQLTGYACPLAVQPSYSIPDSDCSNSHQP